MIALTIRQPYAWRVVHGTKTVENRTRPTQQRGLVLIHAGAAVHEHFARHPMEHLPKAAIVGAVQLVGSHSAQTCGDRCADRGALLGEWMDVLTHDEQGRALHHWELADAIAFDDSEVVRDVRGALGFWSLNVPSQAGLARLALDSAKARAAAKVRRV